MKFDCYSDPSHGWVKVPRKKLVELGISGQITSCSYQRGDWVYLEVDCDLSTFATAMEKVGKTVELREHVSNRRSKIRSYDLYVNTNVSFPKPTPKKVERTGNYALVYKPTFNEDGWESEKREYVKVYVGDFVGFKSDYEQSGKVTKIVGSGRRAKLYLHDDEGFGGDYLRYSTDTMVYADDCWVD